MIQSDIFKKIEQYPKPALSFREIFSLSGLDYL